MNKKTGIIILIAIFAIGTAMAQKQTKAPEQEGTVKVDVLTETSPEHKAIYRPADAGRGPAENTRGRGTRSQRR